MCFVLFLCILFLGLFVHIYFIIFFRFIVCSVLYMLCMCAVCVVLTPIDACCLICKKCAANETCTDRNRMKYVIPKKIMQKTKPRRQSSVNARKHFFVVFYLFNTACHYRRHWHSIIYIRACRVLHETKRQQQQQTKKQRNEDEKTHFVCGNR